METPIYRDSFIFYRSFLDCIEEADNESQLRLYRAIVRYALNQDMPELKGMEKAVWLAIKPQLDANLKRYMNGCRGKEHGIKGGAPLGNSNARKTTPKQPQVNPKTTANENVNENYNDNVNDNVENRSKTAKRFLPPSLDEVIKFFEDNNFKSDANSFYDYYSANGWNVGKSKMKDWKAAARNWERRQPEFRATQPRQTRPTNITEQIIEPDYDDTDFGGRKY